MALDHTCHLEPVKFCLGCAIRDQKPLDARALADAFLERAAEWMTPEQVLYVSPEMLALYERVLAGRPCYDCGSTIMPDEVHIRVTTRVLDVCVPFTVEVA